MSAAERQTPEQIAENLQGILERTAEYSRPCKACGVQLWFIRHRNGKLAPYTFEGVNHFSSCPSAKEFKRA